MKIDLGLCLLDTYIPIPIRLVVDFLNGSHVSFLDFFILGCFIVMQPKHSTVLPFVSEYITSSNLQIAGKAIVISPLKLTQPCF